MKHQDLFFSEATYLKKKKKPLEYPGFTLFHNAKLW